MEIKENNILKLKIYIFFNEDEGKEILNEDEDNKYIYQFRKP